MTNIRYVALTPDSLARIPLQTSRSNFSVCFIGGVVTWFYWWPFSIFLDEILWIRRLFDCTSLTSVVCLLR